MRLNPYVHFLGERDAQAVLSSTPGNLRQMIARLTPEQIETPWEPGKWNVRQIVAHLADCELVFAFRIRQTLAEDAPVIQPFDQDRWAANYALYDLNSALAMFEATRVWNLRLVAGLGADELERPTTHPERGAMTLQTILETMGGHDRNHLLQIQRVAEDAYIGTI